MGHAKRIFLALGITALVLLVSQSAFCQEAGPAQQAVGQDQTQWVWGEVSAVDTDKGELSVTYLDYDTDQEKKITISTDEKTVYENIKALSEIEQQNAVSIDYVVSGEKNIAKNISVDKTDEIEPPETVASEELPQDAPETVSSEELPQDAPAEIAKEEVEGAAAGPAVEGQKKE